MRLTEALIDKELRKAGLQDTEVILRLVAMARTEDPEELSRYLENYIKRSVRTDPGGVSDDPS